MNNDLFNELKERGLINQTSNEEKIKELINNGKAIFYVGIDPTANSLHVGHLLVLTFVKRLIKNGNKAIIVIGGGTSLIGDPTNKNEIRKMLLKKEINNNCKCLKKQLKKIFRGELNKITILNNLKWLSKQKHLDFVRNIGIHFNINEMLKAECYQKRLTSGLTFLEFSYMLLQAYDFYYLNQKYGCNLQVGGSDQWSNMLAGLNIIKKNNSDIDVNVLTIKLLVNSNGSKMGKTEEGTIWLEQDKTSELTYKKFWINIKDDNLFNFIKMLSMKKLEEIEEITKFLKNNKFIPNQIKYQMNEKYINNINDIKKKFADEMKKYQTKTFRISISNLFKIFQNKKIIYEVPFYKNDKEISICEFLKYSNKLQEVQKKMIILPKNKKETIDFITNKKVFIRGKKIDNYNYQLNEDDIVVVNDKYQFKIKKTEFKYLDKEAKNSFYEKLKIKILKEEIYWDQEFKDSFSEVVYFFKNELEERKKKIYEIFIKKILESCFNHIFETKEKFYIFIFILISISEDKIFFLPLISMDDIKNYYKCNLNEKYEECKNINKTINEEIVYKKNIANFFYQRILDKNIYEIVSFNSIVFNLINIYFFYTYEHENNIYENHRYGNHHDATSYTVIPAFKIAIFKFFDDKNYFFLRNDPFLKELENKFCNWCSDKSLIYSCCKNKIEEIIGEKLCFNANKCEISTKLISLILIIIIICCKLLDLKKEKIKEIVNKELCFYNANKCEISTKLIPLILIIMIICREFLNLKNEKYKLKVHEIFKEEYEKQKKYDYLKLKSNSFEKEMNNYKEKILFFLKNNEKIEKNNGTKNIINNLIKYLSCF